MNSVSPPIFDISLPLDEQTIVYPGNPAISLTRKPGATSVHTEISMGSHTGTHIDAPLHIFPEGAGVDAIDLSCFLGACRVLDFTDAVQAISVSELQKHDIKKGERLLAKTKNSLRGYKAFYEDYVYLDGDAADFLVEKEIILFGIDSLSIKKKGGADTRPHTSLLKQGVVIVEGLDLSGVTPGSYTLICLPLRFKGLDGSPARVLLVSGTIES